MGHGGRGWIFPSQGLPDWVERLVVLLFFYFMVIGMGKVNAACAVFGKS